MKNGSLGETMDAKFNKRPDKVSLDLGAASLMYTDGWIAAHVNRPDLCAFCCAGDHHRPGGATGGVPVSQPDGLPRGELPGYHADRQRYRPAARPQTGR